MNIVIFFVIYLKIDKALLNNDWIQIPIKIFKSSFNFLSHIRFSFSTYFSLFSFPFLWISLATAALEVLGSFNEYHAETHRTIIVLSKYMPYHLRSIHNTFLDCQGQKIIGITWFLQTLITVVKELLTKILILKRNY